MSALSQRLEDQYQSHLEQHIDKHINIYESDFSDIELEVITIEVEVVGEIRSRLN